MNSSGNEQSKNVDFLVPCSQSVQWKCYDRGKELIWELRDQGSGTNYFALQGNTFLNAML